MLAALSESGKVTGMGAPKVELGMSEYEQVQAAFDNMFDVQESDAARSCRASRGIREAFAIATGVDIATVGGADRPLRESFARRLTAYVRASRPAPARADAHLREADVTTASFSFLLGTSMNKRLLKDYQAWPSEWQKFTTITAIKDFKQQDRIRLGAFGSLSTVAEDAAYTTLTLSDTRAIYTPTKRGNLVQVTRETIINDDLYAIKQIPQKLAVAAAFTLAEFVYNLLAPNFGNIYDAHPLFDSVNHLNTGVIAGQPQHHQLRHRPLLRRPADGRHQDAQADQHGRQAHRAQAALPAGTVPDLEFTAMTLLKSAGLPGGNNNDINPMMGYAEPIIAPQLNALTAGPASTTICDRHRRSPRRRHPRGRLRRRPGQPRPPHPGHAPLRPQLHPGHHLLQGPPRVRRRSRRLPRLLPQQQLTLASSSLTIGAGRSFRPAPFAPPGRPRDLLSPLGTP